MEILSIIQILFLGLIFLTNIVILRVMYVLLSELTLFYKKQMIYNREISENTYQENEFIDDN